MGDVIETAIQGLSGDEIAEVVKGLAKYLVIQGQVREEVVEYLSKEFGKSK